MSQDAIIEKIKKLLRMKRGGTAGEIENALALAAELARKHGIDLAAVNPDESTQTIKHESEALKSRLSQEARFAAAILVNYFSVGIIVSQQNEHVTWYKTKRRYVVNFIGADWDVEIARYVFVFLQKHFRRSWAQRENRRLKNREAFFQGMFYGLVAKLERERNANPPNEAGLILVGKAVELRQAYMQKHWPNSIKKDLDMNDTDAHASVRAGVEAGLNTSIRKAMEKPAAPARPALPPTQGQMALL